MRASGVNPRDPQAGATVDRGNPGPASEEDPSGTAAVRHLPSLGGTGAPGWLVRYGKFLLVGLTGVFVNLVAFVLTVDALSGTPVTDFYSSVLRYLSKTAANPELYFVGSAVAFVVATIWNFALNSVWTFRTNADRKYSVTGRLGLYFGVSLGSLAVNELVLLGTGTVLPPLIGQGFGIIAGSVVGFFGNNRYTFAEARAT